MSGQPFALRDQVIIEKRDADGRLDFTGDQPPSTSMTFDALYDMYFNANPSGDSAGWDELRAWLEGKGWSIRRKTW